MNRADVQLWLDAYIEAWRQNRPEPVEALFTEDAVYRFRPYAGEGRAVEGIADIVSSWIEESEGSGRWVASYQPYAVDGDRAVAIGTSRYSASDDGSEEVYHNCFLLRFDDGGRCAEFTEYWMLEPKDE